MFDPSAPHIIILLVVVLLLFGSTRLPGAADSLGRAMHIFRRSVKGEDAKAADNATVTQGTVVQPEQPEQQQQPQLTSHGADQAQQQAQIDALQRQLDALQRQNGGVPAEPQQSQKSV